MSNRASQHQQDQNATASVKLSKQETNNFCIQRGVRQGDTISPMIVILKYIYKRRETRTFEIAGEIVLIVDFFYDTNAYMDVGLRST